MLFTAPRALVDILIRKLFFLLPLLLFLFERDVHIVNINLPKKLKDFLYSQVLAKIQI